MLNQNNLVLLLCTLIGLNDAYRILVVFPLCAPSHNILGKGVVNSLLESGHEVVQLTCFPDKENKTNLTQIDLSHVRERALKENKDKYEGFKLKDLVGHKNFVDTIFFYYIAYDFQKAFLTDDVMMNFLSDTEQHFDAVVVEWFFSTLYAGMGPVFQAPLIWLGTTEAHWQVLRVIDEIPNPAYTIDMFSETIPPFNFLERASGLWSIFKKYFLITCIVEPFEKYVYNNVYGAIGEKRNVTIPSFKDAAYNASILLLNSHPSIGIPFKLPQNAHYIGGYHIDIKPKPLPQDFQKLMDEAKHGVIYFSMGSNLQSKDMSDNMRDSLLKMFSGFKETVIWKFESDLENVPKNIHLTKWAPQQSILAHPNIKMFITHGGQLSTTEAIHHGVPVVGIPVYGDQHINMRNAAEKGYGIAVDLAENMADELSVAIREILNNPNYKNRAKELSALFHYRQMTPQKELAYWVEYAIKTRGALHLRSPALNVPLYQKLYLDLLLTFVLVIYVLRKMFNRFFGNKTSIKIKKN
ncbi:unnamed protein product [Diatraea saccharalis]|uniref:Glucuronosyltransferase n=1 Tax=Diatraea saccharalis TaxID=40085 RepID=A0A9N9WJI1_9NEOP|nr:unnamed protein product [Diatraea saccharalis]